MKNYLWNMFARIKNGQLVKKAYIIQRRRRNCVEFLNVLWDEGFILGYSHLENNEIQIKLKYVKDKPMIKNIKIISKPGHKIYYSIKQIWKINSRALIIFSTNKGIKSITECRKENLGGEPIILIN